MSCLRNSCKAGSGSVNIQKVAAEKPFLEYLHGYPGEPIWLTALMNGDTRNGEPDANAMKEMLVKLRFHARVLFEREQFLTRKLKTSERKLTTSKEQLSLKEEQVRKLRRQIENRTRQFDLERGNLYQTLKEARDDAKREKEELEVAIERATETFKSEKSGLQHAIEHGRHKLAQAQNRLEESINETAHVTTNFKRFYEEFLKMEDEMASLEKRLHPLQQDIHGLAEVLQLEPEEFLQRLRKLKTVLQDAGGLQNRKELLCNILLLGEEGKIFEDEEECISTNIQVNTAKNSGSSIELVNSNSSCPGSEKVVSEETKTPAAQEVEKDGEERSKHWWQKGSLKIPWWTRRRGSLAKRK